MKLYILVWLAFSTTIDVSEALNCYSRTDSTGGDGSSTICTGVGDICIAYFTASGKNVGACAAAAGACTMRTRCKSCTFPDCNKASLITRKCYSRTDDATEGAIDTECTTNPSTAKCISYFDASGKNLGECAVDCTGKTNCQICDTDNCNKRALIRKCYKRDGDTAATAEGAIDTPCDPAASDAKCVAYTSGGNNLAKCNPGGCTTALLGTNPDCKDCTTTDNCNTRALLATTAAPATTAAGGAAPTTPRAAATRASVGWQTEIMAASVCVLALMKPF